MRVEKQRQRRAKRESGISAVIAESVVLRRGEQQFGGRHGREDLAIAAELDRDHGDRDDDCDPDQDVFDNRDRRRGSQPARIGEGGENDKSDDQRQVAADAGRFDAERR